MFTADDQLSLPIEDSGQFVACLMSLAVFSSTALASLVMLLMSAGVFTQGLGAVGFIRAWGSWPSRLASAA